LKKQLKVIYQKIAYLYIIFMYFMLIFYCLCVYLSSYCFSIQSYFKKGMLNRYSYLSKTFQKSKFIVGSFPRRRLILSQHLLRERLSLHILTIVCIRGLISIIVTLIA